MLKEIIRSGRAPSRGFTMTEVLVVIGVAGIFLALLIPAISMARQTANAVKCLGKQRQFMQAIMSYASDHDGTLPAPNWGTAQRGWLYDPTVLDSHPGPGLGIKVGAPNNFRDYDMETGLLYSYLNSHDVYHCTTSQSTYETDTDTVQVVTSFVMNGAVCGYANGGKAYDLKSFSGNDIILWEIRGTYPTSDSGEVNDGANWPAECPTTRHKGGSTVGFLDGHAELMTSQQFINEWYYNIPGRLWCAPKQVDGGRQTWINHIAPTPWPSQLPVEAPDP